MNDFQIKNWHLKLKMAVPQQLLPTLMPLYSFKPYRWTIVQPQLDPWPISRQKGNIPIPRSGHRMIYFEGHLYSFGGFNPKLINGEFSNDEESDSSEYYPLFMELWQFNTATRRWRKIPITGEVPEQLASHTALFVTRPKRKLLVYGGTGMPFGQTASNMVYLCDLSNSYTWEKVVVTKNEVAPTVGNHFPKKLYGQAITLSENGRFLYTIGGTSGFQYFMDVHRLDMETNSWEQLHAGAVDAHIMDHAINMSPTPR
jgi:N-acetylneuraminic acid mutarotase